MEQKEKLEVLIQNYNNLLDQTIVELKENRKTRSKLLETKEYQESMIKSLIENLQRVQ